MPDGMRLVEGGMVTRDAAVMPESLNIEHRTVDLLFTTGARVPPVLLDRWPVR